MNRNISLMLILGVFLFGAFIGQAQTSSIDKKTVKDSIRGSETKESGIISKVVEVSPLTNLLVVDAIKFSEYYNLKYYHKFSNYLVVGIGEHVYRGSFINNMGLSLEARFHPIGDAMNGFYLAPNSSVYFSNANGYRGIETAISYSLGGLIGWQFIADDVFVLGIGIGFEQSFITGHAMGVNFNFKEGSKLVIRLELGYAW